MDESEYLDQFLHSPSWSDVDLRQRLSGLCYNEEENNNSNTTSMINSNGSSVESLAAQDASSAVLSLESDYGVNTVVNQDAAQLQDDKQNFHPSNGMVNGSSKHMRLGCPDNMTVPMTGNISSSSLPYSEIGNSQCNSLEPSVFQSFQKDFRTLLQIPHSNRLPSYEGVSSISPGLGQDRTGGFGLQGQYIDNDFYSMEHHSNNFPTSVSSKGARDLENYALPSFASGHQTTMTTNRLQSLSQTATAAAPGECNATGKPRVRARRGQATDPHSIAERLRREKIADRMKNLQELLPNPNKADKASMLDEIIEYVKFLQLQVKVLSMSRLGAAGAVVPLITDYQAEGGNGLLLSPSSGHIADIVFPSDEVAFERELVKLMESNVTKAMQFLQTKGLCLMPVALASAMSPGKEKENGVHRMPFNGDAIMRNTAAAESNNVAVRPEDGNKTSLFARDVKPKTKI